MGQPRRRRGSSSFAWMPFLQPSFTGFLRTISRALQSRGYIEEVSPPTRSPATSPRAAASTSTGRLLGDHELRDRRPGQGAKYVLDGTRLRRRAMFNPEGDMGDIEMWELVKPIDLPRRGGSRPTPAGSGRHRGGSTLRVAAAWSTGPRLLELQNIGTGRRARLAGLFGGYPGADGLHPQHPRLRHRSSGRARGEAYPVADVDFEESRPDGDPAASTREAGRRHDHARAVRQRRPVPVGDEGRRAASAIRCCARSRASRRTSPEGHLLPRFAESVYGVSDREAFRRRRLERARAGSRVGAEQRERILAQDLIDAGEGDVRRVDAPLAALGGRVPRLLGSAGGLRLRRRHSDGHRPGPEPGKVTPRSRPTPSWPLRAYRAPGTMGSRPPSAASSTARRSATCSTRSSPAARSRTSSPAIKDPDRFEKWLSVLQERVAYEDPIVLPVRRGPEHRAAALRRASSSIRSDAGDDFCRSERELEDARAVFVRDTDERYGRSTRSWATRRATGQQLREYYCPLVRAPARDRGRAARLPGLHEYLPDIEGFYRGWLGREVPA